MILKRVSTKVTHQEIGGKIININDDVCNPACFNFVMRRPDFDVITWPYKLYYGHVDGLGYVVSEDELEDI